MQHNYITLRGYACLILQEDNKVLLLKRQNTGFSDNTWALPGGTLEDCETIDQCLIREIKEEININLNMQDLNLVHLVLHQENNNIVKIGYYFTTKCYTGILNNNEPHKHSDLQWFNLDNLPESVSTYTKHALSSFKNNKRCSIVDLV